MELWYKVLDHFCILRSDPLFLFLYVEYCLRYDPHTGSHNRYKAL